MPFKLWKRGNVWYYSGTVKGRRIRESSGTSDKTRAQRIAAEAEAQEWNRRLDGPGASLRFSDCALHYRESGKPTRHLDKVEDYWKNTLVAEINPGAVRRGAVKSFPNGGPATRNRQFIVVTQAVINFAAQAGWCAHLKVKRFKVDTKIKDPVTLPWAQAFAAAAAPHLGALCLFMYGTGARIGEAVALTWSDVDLAAATAKIRQTKIGDERIAHLSPPVIAAIANIPSNRRRDEPVFKYLDRLNVKHSWNAAIKRAGIKHLTPHSCRHGFATTMLQKGVDVKTVAKLGGWKDVATLVRTYAHAMGDPTVTDVIFGTNLAHSDVQRKLKR